MLKSEDERVEVGALANISGMALRFAKFLSDNGVLIPDQDTVEAGTGVHRRYSATEIGIACVLAQLSAGALPVSVLRLIADELRPYFKKGRVDDLQGAVAIRSARRGIGSNYLVIGIAGSAAERVTISFRHIPHGQPVSINPAENFAALRSARNRFVALVDLNWALADTP